MLASKLKGFCFEVDIANYGQEVLAECSEMQYDFFYECRNTLNGRHSSHPAYPVYRQRSTDYYRTHFIGFA